MGEADPAHTFVFADLAGFTALTEAHGDQEAADLASEFSRLVCGVAADRGGEPIKTIGDAVMVRCDDAAASVVLGLDVVDAVSERPHFPVVRVGMDTGGAVERNGDWFGSTVNIAARVCGLSGGGEVLLSQATYEAAAPLAGVNFRRRGPQRLRNVTTPVEVFEAVRSGASHEAGPIDPVCRMAVTPEHAAGRLIHAGREYFFCSLACVHAFAAAPDDYVDT